MPESECVGPNGLANHGFNYHNAAKILGAKMYEPVSDGDVSIITPKYSIRNAFDQSDAEDDAVGRLEVGDAHRPRNMLNLNHKMTNDCDSNERPSNMGDNCIDIDHINLERNYRNKFKTIGVQTHTVRYRLRFWPKSASSNLKCLDGGVRNIVKCCLKTLSQWFLSQVGLTIILVFWALLGAAAFYKTEGPAEIEQMQRLEKLKKDIAVELSTDLRQMSGHDDLWPKTIEKYLRKHETLITEAANSGYDDIDKGNRIWTYPGCILFIVVLMTTLGFGAPVPKTALGRGAAVLFSSIGIPLHFLLILNMASLASGILQSLATVKQQTSDIPQDGTHAKRKWLTWFPAVTVFLYYVVGVVCFGILRTRTVTECLLFPLDFTADGGVAKTAGYTRILYALYLEGAVTLAATIASIIQAAASKGLIDYGLRLGLLTKT